MKYEKGKKITDICQFKKGKKYMSELEEIFEFSHIGSDERLYFKDDGQHYHTEEKEYNCIGFNPKRTFCEAIEIEELPDTGLVVLKKVTKDVIIYRTGEHTGYGFYGNRYDIEDGSEVGYNFPIHPERWRPATEEEEEKFIDLLKEECERRGLFDDTKIEKCLYDSFGYNSSDFEPFFSPKRAWNKNGCIFHNGKFAEPLEEEDTTLDDKITELIELGKEKGLEINITVEK